MQVCDWCKEESGLYNTWIQTSKKPGDGHTIQLCARCANILEKREAEAVYNAVLEVKREREVSLR